MRVLFVVNSVRDLQPKQSTTALIQRAALRGWHVGVVGVHQLALGPTGDVIALVAHTSPQQDNSPSALLEQLAREETEKSDILSWDIVMIRTNPAREPTRQNLHETALLLLRIARDRGSVVLNDPSGLMLASSKLYLAHIPESFRPRTLVAHDAGLLRSFIQEQQGPCVLKPIRGTRGSDVFFIQSATDPNLSQIIDVISRSGSVMAQSYVPEAHRGDVRILLLDGEVIEVGGRIAAAARVPGIGEFRSNVAAGGRSERAHLHPNVREIIEAIGPRLRMDGLFLVGLDVINSKVVEINVFSPGGFGAAEHFEGQDFVGVVLDAMRDRASRSTPGVMAGGL